ncbi:hypothetical protein PsAD13_02205 [Pseudovibrio sp. Ad13]|uniref:hypothetical protein n=1 Tax=Pseudovibrio sp. Ad13 TaxID=989396 RepID=UPI0007AE681D|nr:hypothetical protein [Pseudovibrio sp. Ad13]KZK84740.1 hypothetical protein PsAD13_02205 [Pseudovibrio sp. Ad13]
MASEAELLSSLCFHIARVLHDGITERYLEKEYDSINDLGRDYKEACFLLNRLGIVDGKSFPEFHFAIPLDQVERHLSGVGLKNLVQEKDEIFRLFLFCLMYFRVELSSELDPFEVSDTLTPAMEHMVSCGYAEKMRGKYRWAPKIVSYMIASGEWNANQFQWFTQFNPEAAIGCDEVWARLSFLHKNFLALKVAALDDEELWKYFHKRMNAQKVSYFEVSNGDRVLPPKDMTNITKELRTRLLEVRARQPFWTWI